jgi:hypothetical protein
MRAFLCRVSGFFRDPDVRDRCRSLAVLQTEKAVLDALHLDLPAAGRGLVVAGILWGAYGALSLISREPDREK